MTPKPVRVEFTKNGLRDLIAAASSWREHHPSRLTAFDDEFAAALELLKQFPEIAPVALLRRQKGARLKVLAETGHLVLYRYAKRSRSITILVVVASKATKQRPGHT